MKLVIEHSDRIYAFFEPEKHHEKVNKEFRDKTKEVAPSVLDKECDLSISLPKGSYMVIPVKKKKLKAKCRAKSNTSTRTT